LAPVTASGIYLGAYAGPRRALPLTLAILLISDYALLYVNPYHTHLGTVYAPWRLWYGTSQLFVYGSFLVSALVGQALRVHRTPTTVAVATLFCSLQFFFITNAGVWVAGAYSRGLSGLYDSYVAGLPFFRNTVAGDLIYSAVFFGSYEIVRVFREA